MSEYNCSMADWDCPQKVTCGNRTADLNGVEGLEDVCLTLEEYLERHLGHRRSPVFLPVCLTYMLIFLVGAFGNVLTCIVIARNKVMRTPTNYYLFSLAVSDLLVLLLGMPLELYEMWQNYPFLLGKGGCYFKTFLFETVCFASILNVTALSIERYIAVVHPLRAKYVVTRAHAKRVIATVWGMSVVCAMPNTSLHGIHTLPPVGQGTAMMELQESAICTVVKPRWMYNLTIQITTLLFFMLPMLTISALYLLIGLQLKREKMLQVLEAETSLGGDSYSNVRSQQQKARRRQVTKMLFVLVVVFGICWAPFHTDRLMWSFIDEWSDIQLEVYKYVHILSGVFFYLSSAVNPILYNLMSTRFREMFKEVMCHQPRRPAPRKQSLSVTRVTLRSTLSEAAPIAGVMGETFDLNGDKDHQTTCT
ncbi:neuromedin-U receptor 1 [Esox lucius]|uniref:G-protein coupled receptors family 1 profile domain-containing protein n=1 Tax=Esox lucius TaxID=8010 RepID=A0A3P8ZK13_ESOLU|nr:neuromedin-U receptor 1 [Esox lucius]XP_034149797.1 neuromedin-U receptor 1 [Esox lucius]